MIEPCRPDKMQDLWFCQHCIKQVRASSTHTEDDDDVAEKPIQDDPEKPEIKYLAVIKMAANNPEIDVKLQAEIKRKFRDEFEIQYEILAKKDLLSDAEKHPIQIEIGNLYKHVDPNSLGNLNARGGLYNTSYEHDWTCYVKMQDSALDKYMPFLIQRVAFRLHQSRRT